MKKLLVSLLVVSAALAAPCDGMDVLKNILRNGPLGQKAAAGFFGQTFANFVKEKDVVVAGPTVPRVSSREEYVDYLARGKTSAPTATTENNTIPRRRASTPEPQATQDNVQNGSVPTGTSEAPAAPATTKETLETAPAPEENVQLNQGAQENVGTAPVQAAAPTQDGAPEVPKTVDTDNALGTESNKTSETNQSKTSSTRSSKTATPEPEEDVQLNQVAQETLGTAPAQASTATVETNKAPVPTPAPTAVPTQEPTVQASAPTDANQQQDQTAVPAPTQAPTAAPTPTLEEANAIEKFITSLKTNVWTRTGAVAALGATALVTMFIINLRNVVGLVGKARFKAALTKTIHQATAPGRWITKKITTGSKTGKVQAFVALIALGLMTDALVRAETSYAAQAYNAIAG